MSFIENLYFIEFNNIMNILLQYGILDPNFNWLISES